MQLRDVPAVAMQLYNDSVHLSSCVMKLRETFQWWDAAEDISKRLKAVGELVFEEQLAAQREALMGVLDDAGGFSETADEGSFKRCERAVRQVQHNLETLARTLQVNSADSFVAPALTGL